MQSFAYGTSVILGGGVGVLIIYKLKSVGDMTYYRAVRLVDVSLLVTFYCCIIQMCYDRQGMLLTTSWRW